jgi:hypothetical protein
VGFAVQRPVHYNGFGIKRIRSKEELIMLRKVITYITYPVLIAVMVLCLVAVVQAAGGNIDAVDKWAWGTNVGWINFRPTHGGVTVYDDHLEGYAWGENIGWIRVGTHTGGSPHTYANTAADNYGVNNDGNGNLSGYAWGTNVGWINFNPTHSQVTIDTATGRFDGYAWGENIGWIHFRGTGTVAYGVIVNHTLTVNTAEVEGGTGTVTSEPAGVHCGEDCAEDYDQGTVVTLRAHPGVKSYVIWGGDCTGTGATVQVPMDADKTCTATFSYPVGGIVVPVNRLGLLVPWMGLAGLAGLAVLGVALVRRRRD